MSQRTLSNVITRHQVFLERLKTSSANDFAAVLPKLEKAIVEVLAAVESNVLQELNKRELNKLLKDLQDQQKTLILAQEEKFRDHLTQVAEHEADFEHSVLAATGKALPKAIIFSPVSPDKAYKAALTQPLSANGQLLDPFISSWGQKHIAGVEQAVLKAWGQGQTVGQLIQAIRGTRKLNYKDGLVDVSRRQAEAIARTAVQHVSQAARSATWGENSDIVEGYTFVATLDGRTTQVCRSLDGRVFELGKGPQPPVHVNCRSTTIPKLPAMFDFLDEGATRSSKDGYVEANQSYYQWLKGQPAEFQDEALGPARAKLFRDGGLNADQFASLNLGRNFEPMTLDEMRAKAPEVFRRSGLD
jgi:SPP1 gp7 family putative phage head morphogenesis protein